MLKLQRQHLFGFIFLVGVLPGLAVLMPERDKAMADVAANIAVNSGLGEEEPLNLQLIQETTLLATAPPSFSPATQRIEVIVTGYSSSIWETADDPFITASGSRVRDGIVANNLLSFGTKIRLPELFGDKVFVVEDRMHSRKGYYHVDIWFSSREAALNFGAKLTVMEILAD